MASDDEDDDLQRERGSALVLRATPQSTSQLERRGLNAERGRSRDTANRPRRQRSASAGCASRLSELKVSAGAGEDNKPEITFCEPAALRRCLAHVLHTGTEYCVVKSARPSRRQLRIRIPSPAPSSRHPRRVGNGPSRVAHLPELFTLGSKGPSVDAAVVPCHAF